MSLSDNPFLNTPEAAGLGVPLMNERAQKIALAAQAGGDGPRDAKLREKAAQARKVRDAQTARVDLNEPAPTLAKIIKEVTGEAASEIYSTPGTVAASPSTTPSKAIGKPTVRKTTTQKATPKAAVKPKTASATKTSAAAPKKRAATTRKTTARKATTTRKTTKPAATTAAKKDA
ncbi:MAG: hypothetical protein QNL92_01740 [Octadecabacter sp.]